MSKEQLSKTALVGIKLGMTQVYDEANRLIPVTLLEAGPCPVVQVKHLAVDGYDALQIGFKPQKEQRLPKSLRGHLKKNKLGALSSYKEFRTPVDSYSAGDILTVDVFKKGEQVDVIGTSKGEGTRGVVDRWGFAGGKRSHGSMSHRRGGSYGMCQDPGRVYPGRKMPGRSGGTKVTAQNLVIVEIFSEKNLLLVKGSVPGPNGALVFVRGAKKKG